MTSKEVVISDKARDDIDRILYYTETRWGHQQQKKFKKIIFQSIQCIADNPFIGITQKELAPNLRRFNMKYYYIFYTPQEDCVFLNRLIHTAQNIDDISL